MTHHLPKNRIFLKFPKNPRTSGPGNGPHIANCTAELPGARGAAEKLAQPLWVSCQQLVLGKGARPGRAHSPPLLLIYTHTPQTNTHTHTYHTYTHTYHTHHIYTTHTPYIHTTYTHIHTTQYTHYINTHTHTHTHTLHIYPPSIGDTAQLPFSKSLVSKAREGHAIWPLVLLNNRKAESTHH